VTPISFSFSGSATIAGAVIMLPPQTFDASGQPTATLVITTATCDFVYGTFDQSVQANLTAAGATPTELSAWFAATRESEASAGASEALKQLTSTAGQLLQAFEQSGQLDTGALFELVKAAESFSTSLKKNTACGLVSDSATFNLAITDIVKEMLTLAFGKFADQLSTAQLADLVYAGVATGAMGAGAIDQKTSKELLGQAETLFTARLDDAIAAKSKADIEHILEIASTMSWTTLEADASAALKKLK
jgi:hypothetical protein